MNYPSVLKIYQSIDDGINEEKMRIVDGTDAIELTIKVNSSQYSKEKVKEAVNKICQKVVEYYDET